MLRVICFKWYPEIIFVVFALIPQTEFMVSWMIVLLDLKLSLSCTWLILIVVKSVWLKTLETELYSKNDISFLSVYVCFLYTIFFFLFLFAPFILCLFPFFFFLLSFLSNLLLLLLLFTITIAIATKIKNWKKSLL